MASEVVVNVLSHSQRNMIEYLSTRLLISEFGPVLQFIHDVSCLMLFQALCNRFLYPRIADGLVLGLRMPIWLGT